MKKLRRLRASLLKRIVAYNDDRVLPGVWDRLTIIAANARAMSGEEWEQITPWGEFPNRAGLQRLTRKQGEDMVKAFNSLVGKLKGAFRGVPIYCGHPDVDPENYKDDRRYGRIEGLEAREDGLYCKPAWNDLGLKNKEQGYWLYPSGVWKFKRCPGGVIEPTELVSVGLTNSPVIKQVQPWARNAKAANAGTSAGAHKGWATRRANGAAGAKNPRAVRALATMTAKKAGRRPTADDKAAAGEKLEKKASKRTTAVKLDPAKVAAAHKETADSLRNQAASIRDKSPGQAKALDEAASHHETLAGASPKLTAKPTPPPLPARAASTSASSGPGTHIHIHAGGDTPAAPEKKHGLIASILDAFARPHVHDGGAINAFPFDQFYGRRRLVATNGRKQTAAANANA